MESQIDLCSTDIVSNQPENDVRVAVYDLSAQLRAKLSHILFPFNISGIWHTEVHVFGQIYYYSDGIVQRDVSEMGFQDFVQFEEIGITTLTPHILNEWVMSQSDNYTSSKYHVLDHNCCDFANELCEFLTGVSIPLYLRTQSNDFLSTFAGRKLHPYINTIFANGHVGSGVVDQYRNKYFGRGILSSFRGSS
ncbi:putative Desumoylating isopeptidase 1 [Blattamonas nauphoetae]|uniref:Desumoylating isopeptidase 1 n=1 Tax=Blattamonas nauphoetae TaxID=2049346 RepID=A0ABQ9XHE1_9EUKA|nr:putative Desumoylating isopeptidase 1 [Blattamonas nauphoetae]